MDNNTSLTAREIFAQIQILQKDITNNSSNALYRMTEAISEMRDEDGNVETGAVEAVSNVFTAREHTLNELLAFYIRLYDEAKAAEAKQA